VPFTFRIKLPADFKIPALLKKYLFDEGKGYAAKWDETGEVLYVRGLINAMLGVEAIRIASPDRGISVGPS
jgi:branched-chain amino acid transport system substrate-binding protein